MQAARGVICRGSRAALLLYDASMNLLFASNRLLNSAALRRHVGRSGERAPQRSLQTSSVSIETHGAHAAPAALFWQTIFAWASKSACANARTARCLQTTGQILAAPRCAGERALPLTLRTSLSRVKAALRALRGCAHHHAANGVALVGRDLLLPGQASGRNTLFRLTCSSCAGTRMVSALAAFRAARRLVTGRTALSPACGLCRRVWFCAGGAHGWWRLAALCDWFRLRYRCTIASSVT